jgi:preprotein translocase subunit SecY
MTLGLGTYISASIIVQLLQTIVPTLDDWSKDGAVGRLKLNQLTRVLAIPITFIQGFSIFLLIRSAFPSLVQDVTNLDIAAMLAAMLAGSMLLIWLTELLSENGIANGSTLIDPSFCNSYCLLSF